MNRLRHLKPRQRRRLTLLLTWVFAYFGVMGPLGFIKVRWILIVAFFAVQALALWALVKICDYN